MSIISLIVREIVNITRNKQYSHHSHKKEPGERQDGEHRTHKIHLVANKGQEKIFVVLQFASLSKQHLRAYCTCELH